MAERIYRSDGEKLTQQLGDTIRQFKGMSIMEVIGVLETIKLDLILNTNTVVIDGKPLTEIKPLYKESIENE